MKSLDKINIKLGICIILLQIYDIIITLLGLNKGATEGNPVIVFFMEQLGVITGLLVVKGVVLVVVISCILYNKNICLIRFCFIIVMVIYFTSVFTFTINHISTV